MAGYAATDSALAHRANLNIAAAVVGKLGTGASDALIGKVIDDVRASHSVAELASAGGMGSVLGAVEIAISRNAETHRPFNDTDSRAAQLAALGGHAGGHWHGDGSAHGRYGLLAANRLAREAASEGGEGSGSSSSRSSAVAIGTGSEPAGAAFWGTSKGMMLTRSFANDNNMNWAPPDLMKMGRPALQALKESGLKGEGYKALHDPSGLHLNNSTIVAGAAGYMKRNGIDHNEAAKSSAAVDKLKMPEGMRKRHRDAVEGIHTATPENEQQRKEELRKSGDEIEKHDPAHKATVERERRSYKVEKTAAPKAEVATKRQESAADASGAKAAKKESEAVGKEGKAAQVQEQSKGRRAAAQNNFGSL